MTYPERLEKAGVTWRVYQEYDNYGDNTLAFFAAYRGGGANAALQQKARAWAPGSTAQNVATTRGDPLVEAFAADVKAGALPQVSWIVAPTRLCEHPDNPPGYGESLTARLLDALTANPSVWARTVFLINYDENDGFFDHVPPPLPATDAAIGKSTVDVAGEVYRGVPVGLGPRVPMLVVSPWSKGGWVNSQTFDHTSVLRFVEARFGVTAPLITPWRRAVTGDLDPRRSISATRPAGPAAPCREQPAPSPASRPPRPCPSPASRRCRACRGRRAGVGRPGPCPTTSRSTAAPRRTAPASSSPSPTPEPPGRRSTSTARAATRCSTRWRPARASATPCRCPQGTILAATTSPSSVPTASCGASGARRAGRWTSRLATTRLPRR